MGCMDQDEKGERLLGDFISYLEGYIVISSEKQGYGITTDATTIHSSMHSSLEYVILGIFNYYVSGTKGVRTYSSIAQTDHRGY